MRLTLRHVTVSVAGRVLFNPITFEVSAGESVVLMGPSGAGKTTLLASIAGFHHTWDGEMHVDDGAHIQWLIQSSPLLGRRSALDNAMTAGSIRFGPSMDLLSQATALLTRLGLAAQLPQPVFRLSGGERQRVAFARALLASPDVLLADEPTASLDPTAREAVMDVALDAARGGCAVVIATHDPAVAAQCDRTITLDPPSVGAPK